MNEILIKSYDNIMEQQNKMDNKAYIFIGFISFVLAYLCPEYQDITLIKVMPILIIIPLALSLIPIANGLTVRIMSCFFMKKYKNSFNVFYYIDIYNLDVKTFIDHFIEDYQVKGLTKADNKLVEEIIINARILKTKVFWHNLSQFLGVIVIMTMLIIKK